MEVTDGDSPTVPIKEKRISRACDTCYARKIKCDAVAPRCNWCAHHNTPCTYDRRILRKRPRSRVERTHLLDRIDRLEKQLASIQVRTNTPSTPPTASSSSDRDQSIATPVSQASSRPAWTEQSALHFAGWKLGTINSCNGIPVFSEEGQRWIRSRTGEEASLFGLPWHNQVRSNWRVPPDMIQHHDPLELPDKEMVERHLDLYNQSYAIHVFPVIDPPRFRDTISLAYSHPTRSNDPKVSNAQACVFAFLAFATFFDFRDTTFPLLKAEKYAWEAHRIMTVGYLDVCMETLQTAIMMMMVHLFSGNHQYALYQISICARVIYMLGAHTTAYPSCTNPTLVSEIPKYRECYLLRNIFWVCYILDKELSVRTGQPPSLHDDHCDTTLPPPHVQDIYPLMMGYDAGGDYNKLHLFPGDAWMSTIKSKAFTALYSTRALKKTDAELFKDIRELDDDLEQWRQSIPLTHRPTLAFARDTLPKEASTMLSIMLHLDYNHCVAAIHQATNRCKAWSSDEDNAMTGVGSSLEISVEASRSSLLYLQMTSYLIEDDCFWMVLYYPITALLMLFYNVLYHPLDPQSPSDLEMLSKIPSMIRNIPMRMRRLSYYELMQVQLIDELVEELTRLGRCAIEKAKREIAAG